MITMTELSVNRDKGMVPDRPLLIPMVPTPGCSLIQIKINSTDLRALYGLDIVIAYDNGSYVDRIIALVDAIVRAGPAELTIWNITTHRFLSVVSMGRRFFSEVPPRDDLSMDSLWDDLS